MKVYEDVEEFQKTMNVMGGERNFQFERISPEEYLASLAKDLKLASMKLPDSIIREDHVRIACPDSEFELLADVYYKRQPNSSKRPCVIFMHDWAGGGNPALCGDRQGAFFALHGFVFISLYYRHPLYAPCPAALEDLKTTARWARAKAEEYAIDPKMIVSFGSSAGSQWAFMAAATNGSGKFESPCGWNEFSSDINAVILHAAICDVVKDFKDSEIMRVILGASYKENPGLYREFSPIHNISPSMPPFMLVNGDEDATCGIESARALRDKALRLGVDAELIELPGRDHGSTKHPGDLFLKLTKWKDFILRHWREQS